MCSGKKGAAVLAALFMSTSVLALDRAAEVEVAKNELTAADVRRQAPRLGLLLGGLGVGRFRPPRGLPE